MSRSELVSTTGAGLGFLGGVLLAYADSREMTQAENLNALPDATDMVMALDRLQAIAPAVERVSLVVAWFPARETAFATESPPAREVLADSRTVKGGGAAGVATLGAAGVELAQNILTETLSAGLPLVPYLDTLRWVFVAVALAGIAVTIHARLDD